MNLTPTRIKLLQLIAARPKFCVSRLAEELAPRLDDNGRNYGWTRQGAARWGGGYIRPLVTAGLISFRSEAYGVGTVSITDAGRKALADHEAVAGDKQLDTAIESAQ